MPCHEMCVVNCAVSLVVALHYTLSTPTSVVPAHAHIHRVALPIMCHTFTSRSQQALRVLAAHYPHAPPAVATLLSAPPFNALSTRHKVTVGEHYSALVGTCRNITRDTALIWLIACT